jgi:hypothetical protein
MPCNPNSLTITQPPGPSGSPTPGFGTPFAPPNSNNSFATPTGFPEDLTDLINDLTLIVSSGKIQSSLSVNYGKDALDALTNLLDKAFPFLMAYKLILPILDMIICIIEIICSLMNPFALIGKVQRLFRVCIPEFLALFPIFALVVFILSLLNLILTLIEYIIEKILFFVELIINNMIALVQALQYSDAAGIAAITQKLGLILCALPNLFVLLSIFAVIIQVIQDILKLITAIPPCSNSGSTDTSDDSTPCCGPETCPAFIKNNTTITGTTGDLQYYNEAAQGLSSLPAGFPTSFPLSFFNAAPERAESWQFYDISQTIQDAFSNITNAYDLPAGTSIVFFPSSTTYTANTPINQVPYLLSLTFLYNPAIFGRIDPKGIRLVQINNCIVSAPPNLYINNYENVQVSLSTGVLSLVGGQAFENDGMTPVSLNGTQATLGTLIHLPPEITTSGAPVLSPTDGYLFNNLSYTFTIQHAVLFANNLITLGCIPSIAADRDFANTVFGGNAGTNLAELNSLTFPDITGTQACLTSALTSLTNNVSTSGAAEFQNTATNCLNNLANQAASTIQSLLGLGFDPYQSTFSLSPTPQFTSQTITVSVFLAETNGQSITSGMSSSVAAQTATRITGTASFGILSTFVYDGTQNFLATITSPAAGSGTITISFDGIPISTANIPSNLSIPASITVTYEPYTFVYSPFGIGGLVPTGTGDTFGEPDLNNDNKGNS